jgi:tRNA nucleotidyltransferase (CCA-adding enzyme)
MIGLNKQVIERILESGGLYEVGGCVRDSLRGIGISEKDRDYLVTQINFDDLVQILKQHGHVDLVGKSFGVIKFTATPNGTKTPFIYDIALPRSEFSIGEGHRDFDVDFDHTIPVDEDLIRRDFTINAIARNLKTNELIDPYGGLEDLKHGLIRMLRPETFSDDPLRMLRAVQFAARFDFEIEPQTLQAIKDNAGLIESVSSERIQEELSKMLSKADKPSIGFAILKETGMLKSLLPEVAEGIDVDQPGGYHAFDVFNHSIYIMDHLPKKLILRLAGLFHDVAKPRAKEVVDDKARFYNHEVIGSKLAEKALERLRFSNQIIKNVKILIERHMFTHEVSDKGLRRLMRRTGEDLIFDLLDLRRADVIAQGMGHATPEIDIMEERIKNELDRKVPLGVSQLAVGGKDIMSEFSLQESRLIGDILAHLLEYVLDYPEENKKEILIEQARLFLKDKERE